MSALLDVEVDPTTTATFVLTNCAGEIPMFDDALPAGDVPCGTFMSGAYLARIGE